jgi:hypothetical protein
MISNVAPFGLHALVLAYLTSCFTPTDSCFTHTLSLQEMELLLHGLPNIDMDDWVKNTEYTGEFANTPGRLLCRCCCAVSGQLLFGS